MTSSELVSGTVPAIHAGTMGLQAQDAFMGQSADETMWGEMNPQDLAARLEAPEMNRLSVVDDGPGWLHLDFMGGWIRTVADAWEPWSIILSGIWWTRDIQGHQSRIAEAEQ